ncbi:hypothetical protein [Acidovorax sp. NCPPB 4044]|uniref:hypothetical protein n=1 Tax=Acidovorax sp. NCPPB 4044 TaxID=2940490 RepID=UPI002303FD75|nr:hypothetical protein [Acidovorax sp. NCPPB 4044]MDA8522334.1 hypothetical protein [Acidovorax sp. NCPPB 4044]
MNRAAHEAQTRLLEVLGLSDLTAITAVDIALRPGTAPTVRIEQLLLRTFGTTERIFRLEPKATTPAPQVAYDLDAACAAALERVRAGIRRDCDAAHQAVRDGFSAIRRQRAAARHSDCRLRAMRGFL